MDLRGDQGHRFPILGRHALWLRRGRLTDSPIQPSNLARALGPDGNLYVTERERRDIRVLSPEGEVLRTIGGEGQGPGEFEQVPWIVAWRGDTLVAADPHRLMHWFDPEGLLLRSERGPQLP